MVTYNTTTTGFNSIIGMDSLNTLPTWTGVVITLAIFLLVFVTLFFLFKNLRLAIYGAILQGIIYANYVLSSDATESLLKGDGELFRLVMTIIVTILVSVGLGKLLDKFGVVKKIESYFTVEVNKELEEVKVGDKK